MIVITEQAENGSCHSVGWLVFEMCLRIEVHTPGSDGAISTPVKQKARCKFCVTASLLLDILDEDYFNIIYAYFKGLLRTNFEALLLGCNSISKFRRPSCGCYWWLEIGKYKNRIDSAGMIPKPSLRKICELIQTFFLGGGGL